MLHARVVTGCRAVLEEGLAGGVRVAVGGDWFFGAGLTSSGTACVPLSQEGVVLVPARLSVWGQRVLVCGLGMRAALEARLLVVWGASPHRPSRLSVR